MILKTFNFHKAKDMHPPTKIEVLGWYKHTIDGNYFEIVEYHWPEGGWTDSRAEDVDAPYAWAYMNDEPETGE